MTWQAPSAQSSPPGAVYSDLANRFNSAAGAHESASAGISTACRTCASNTPFKVFTNHDSRITAFLAVRFAMGTQGSHNEKPPPGPPRAQPGHCFSAHFCSLLLGKKYCPEPVSPHRQPLSAGLTTSAVRRSPRRFPGCSRCDQHKMNPFRGRGTFDVAMTHCCQALIRPGNHLDTHSPVWHTPRARWFSSGYGLLYRPGFGRQGRRYLHHVSNRPAANRWG